MSRAGGFPSTRRLSGWPSRRLVMCAAAVGGLLLPCPAPLAAREDPGPGLILWNGRVWTGHSAQPRAEAVAIEGHRIVQVGTNDEILSLQQPATRLIDARGGTVLPGFIDAHFHLLDLDPPVSPVNLRWVTSRQELAERVAEGVRSTRDGEWVIGEGWDERKWGGEPPTRAWIDAVSPRHPVWLLRNDESAGLANSRALELVVTNRGDAEGEPIPETGLIRGGPMWVIDRQLIRRDLERAGELAEERMGRLVELGVTSIHHTGSWPELLVLRQLHAEGRLRTRIYAAVPLKGWERLRDDVSRNGRGDRWLHWGGLKQFRNAPWIVGDRTTPTRLDRWTALPTEGEVLGWLLGASRAGLQVMVHAGDDRYLELFNRVRAELGSPDLRFRIEHAHDIPDQWVPLYVRAGVIASVQPPLLSHFDHGIAAGLPPPRNLFPARRLLEAGVVVAFGTDSVTVTPLLSPFQVIQMALERPGPDGGRLTLEECLAAYTKGSAYAEFTEDEKGTLEPGKLADLVVVDRDLFEERADRISRARIRLTVIDGSVAYQGSRDLEDAPPPRASVRRGWCRRR